MVNMLLNLGRLSRILHRKMVAHQITHTANHFPSLQPSSKYVWKCLVFLSSIKSTVSWNSREGRASIVRRFPGPDSYSQTPVERKRVPPSNNMGDSAGFINMLNDMSL